MLSSDFHLNEAGNKLIIIFSSYGIEGQPGETAFARPKFEFVRTLAEYNISCLFLMDRNQHWYHSGVVGLAESIPTLADKLLEFKGRYTKIVTLGHSMGGYAALLFAALCDFDEVIATAPQTSILREHRVAWGDYRWPKKIPEAREASKTPEYFDIRSALARNPRPIYRAWYSSSDATDRKHCQHIQDLQGVEIAEIAAPDHNAAKALRDCGLLDAHLGRLAAR